MNKKKPVFVCSNCGSNFAKWLGKCLECGEWGTIEEAKESEIVKEEASTKALEMFCLNDLSLEDSKKHDTGFSEINRVLGGGLVEGGLILICGEPGMGKSTLLLQICDKAKIEKPVFYFSGEESAKQIKLRADRINVKNRNIFLFSTTNIELVEKTVKQKQPGLVVIDSIQTTQTRSTFGSSISQIREVTERLMRLAKQQNVTIFIVGHVNKEGALAGPKVLEHIVDTVLCLEGERTSNYRILRTVKNRFGSTSEIAVLDMAEEGLVEILDPSTAMLSDNPEPVAGICVTCLLEGTRAMFLEIQALVVKSAFTMPKRTAAGLDYNRLCVLIAVIEKCLGLKFNYLDVYASVVGGFRLSDPSSDLAILLALISTFKDRPILEKTIAFGEVDLIGGIRSVQNAKFRVQEAQRLGFKQCILPRTALQTSDLKNCKIKLIGVKSVKELLNLLQ